MEGKALWLTGIPGSGKTTIAMAIKQRNPDIVLLGMDRMRKIATPNPTYSAAEREILYRSIVYNTKVLIDLGHNVIIDATGHKREWRELARKMIKNFYEVYLRCPIEVVKIREQTRIDESAPRDIYKKAEKGAPVPGVVVPYEEPLHPELIIDTDKTSVDDSVKAILAMLGRKKDDKRRKS